jgi:toxin YoeB
MAEKVVLSVEAEQNRYDILKYYFDETGSSKIPLQIFEQINDAFETIVIFPNSGKSINKKGHHVFVTRPYNIIYRINDDTIEILHIWDTRQNPKNLTL